MFRDEVTRLARETPFRPFRITTDAGRVFDVPFRQSIRVGSDWIMYYYKREPGPAFDRFESIAMESINRVELIGQPQASVERGPATA